MPFLAHFGLKEHPFTLMPNPDFYFPSHDHANVLASVEFALRRDTGILKVVGDIGTGKTLICRLLLRKLVDEQPVAYINAPQPDAQLLAMAVCEEFGVALNANDNPYMMLSRFLIEQHAEGRMCVLVVDEAQALGKEGLETVRLLSNLESEHSKLLQIVLFGQSELDELLRDRSLRQLTQRIVFSFHTRPLSEPDTRRYIEHRLAKSRLEGADFPIMTPEALDLLCRHSNGIPRVINILCDKALLVAFSTGAHQVDAPHVEDAILDSPGIARPLPFLRRRSGRRLALGLTATAAAAGAFFVFVAIGSNLAAKRAVQRDSAPQAIERVATPDAVRAAAAPIPPPEERPPPEEPPPQAQVVQPQPQPAVQVQAPPPQAPPPPAARDQSSPPPPPAQVQAPPPSKTPPQAAKAGEAPPLVRPEPAGSPEAAPRPPRPEATEPVAPKGKTAKSRAADKLTAKPSNGGQDSASAEPPKARPATPAPVPAAAPPPPASSAPPVPAAPAAAPAPPAPPTAPAPSAPAPAAGESIHKDAQPFVYPGSR